ncbi:golgin candidate 5-like isoform X1 [Gossypium australe]|uniref:Golgin candidate 5-like isoform X1 n=1 Tax=Gossypium australe TaxID=47621 RepID=A0A5B6VRX5_9ROSI|nr:golgin candidate 5-like isoform X1 [Gossypium australe]
MGFSKVFQCLLDIFPQVDSRILKAVAIENSKDVDAAAEIVLSEIIPYLCKRTPVASSSLQNQSHLIEPNEDAAIEEEESNQLRRRKVSVGKGTSSSTEPLLETGEVVGDTCLTDSSSNVDSLEAQNAATTSKFHDNNNNEAADIETEELILLGNTEIQKSKSSFSWNASEVDNSLLYANLETKELDSSSQDRTTDIEDGFPRTPQVAPFTSADDTAPLLENGSSNDKLNFDGPVDLNEDLCRSSSLNGTMVGEENAVSMLVPSYCQEQLPESFIGLKSQQGCIGEMSDVEDETFNPVVSRSSQTCRIDLLKEIIEDAKDNKTMQSIMNLMKEVELQEAAAEQAKEEAARGGMDILVKVEELKQMLPHAKEANDMHAGEVYGEKAILVTEVKELENRLLSLSDERDKSLAILDEMRQTLEARQSATQELMKAAEQEKLEKEETARNALAEQEAIMVKVVEESKILRQEAEENSKLREFLMDRGQIIDSLQGEISVICEDIRLLKQKFDDRIPLSKSISSSQTSCILASSGSSLKSRSSDLGSGQWETAKTLEKRSPTPSVDGQSPKSRSSDERSKADGKELSDDGWEIFDKDAEF